MVIRPPLKCQQQINIVENLRNSQNIAIIIEWFHLCYFCNLMLFVRDIYAYENWIQFHIVFVVFPDVCVVAAFIFAVCFFFCLLKVKLNLFLGVVDFFAINCHDKCCVVLFLLSLLLAVWLAFVKWECSIIGAS